MAKLTIPIVKCIGCQYYEGSDVKSIMYCHKAKMPMRYLESRPCAFKSEQTKK